MASDIINFIPNEIVELILENENLTIKDIINFGMTCKHFHRTAFHSSTVWKSKFFQRWQSLKQVYSENCRINNVDSWLMEVQYSIESRSVLKTHLSQMSSKYYKKQELSDLELRGFDTLLSISESKHNFTAYHFFVDELIDIINKPIMYSNLTNRYYAYKVVRYLKQNYLKNEWRKFINLPPKKQLLEKGATIVSQWSQPEKYISYNEISAILDNIAHMAKDLLKESSPDHPVFHTLEEQFDFWKHNNIDDNQWTQAQSKQIMMSLCDVMFNKLSFHGNSELYYSSENSFIDKVLETKKGIPITLAIIFESICRRLGVKCEPVNFPTHFLLRWKGKYLGSDSENTENFYIDVFNGGRFLTRRNCPRLNGVSKCPIDRYNGRTASTASEVVERMASNLELAGRQSNQLNGRAARLRSALELLHMVKPYDTTTILHLARFYMSYQMDLGNLNDILIKMQEDPDPVISSRGQANHIYQMLQDYEKHMNLVPEEAIETKYRSPDVKYAVGMIMEHRRYNYLCVITGWDIRCKASPEWMIEMGVDELNGGANQPFYSVFADDGSSRYAAQENLAIAPVPRWVDHDEVGKFFCEFKGTHYIPNEEKANEYPEDNVIREQILSSSYL